MKIKFRMGKRGINGLIYITPSLYITWNLDKFEENHRTSIEFQWLYFGFGFLLQWENKSVVPRPEYPDLGMFLL